MNSYWKAFCGLIYIANSLCAVWSILDGDKEQAILNAVVALTVYVVCIKD